MRFTSWICTVAGERWHGESDSHHAPGLTRWSNNGCAPRAACEGGLPGSGNLVWKVAAAYGTLNVRMRRWLGVGSPDVLQPSAARGTGASCALAHEHYEDRQTPSDCKMLRFSP